MSVPRQQLLSMVTSQFEFTRGSPLPFGATVLRGGVNFSVFSRHATAVTLVLFYPGDAEPLVEFPFDPHMNRTGDVWHAFLQGLDPGIHYAFRMERTPNENSLFYRYDRQNVLLDPYARAISGHSTWGERRGREPRRAAIIESKFDWEFDQPLNIPLADTVIYELHVRGLTQHPAAGVSRPGTFLGVVEKIPYLKSLGITAVELLPVFEFDDAPQGATRSDYWGYNPVSFFAPKAAYASEPGDAGPVDEFKTMVKALHAAGIEVIVDAVFNHTGEGDERGPTYSFKGIDNPTYYMVNPQTGQYLNYSGCGNTLNCNHPVVRDLVTDVLRYWVTEMHVDGFRFDLASILGRGQDGSVLASPPLLESLALDPVLARTKLIAEAWDAAGLYQVGSFPAWGRWAEWNGRFRDDIRQFVKGDAGMVSALANRLIGSPDLYSASRREPWHSINFITCHDGFTLADLVSYQNKRNEANGEENRDGTDDNRSWNCGLEGPTSFPEVARLRARQARNFATLLMVSQGVPMIQAGDEAGRTQRGNNNAYCQDNEISWFDWSLPEKNAGLVRFFRLLIRLRREHPLLRRGTFAPEAGPAATRADWHGIHLHGPDWSHESRTLAMHLHGKPGDRQDHIYVIANAHWEAHEFELPVLPQWEWMRSVDTSREPPEDIREPGAEERLANAGKYPVAPRSVAVFVGRELKPAG
ncbi:MAG TPA: glycogen debranching protein GlgX [Bryobacteraceae bacterium]|nr:glycogen debranching protein GlgX [Bryobacteraceae bacterium]